MPSMLYDPYDDAIDMRDEQIRGAFEAMLIDCPTHPIDNPYVLRGEVSLHLVRAHTPLFDYDPTRDIAGLFKRDPMLHYWQVQRPGILDAELRPGKSNLGQLMLELLARSERDWAMSRMRIEEPKFLHPSKPARDDNAIPWETVEDDQAPE